MDGYIKTIIIFGIISVVFFAVQLLLCFTIKRIKLKFIPIYILLGFLLLAGLFFIGIFGGTGFMSAERIVAGLLAIGVGSGFVGVAIAWALYRISKRIQTK